MSNIDLFKVLNIFSVRLEKFRSNCVSSNYFFSGVYLNFLTIKRSGKSYLIKKV